MRSFYDSKMATSWFGDSLGSAAVRLTMVGAALEAFFACVRMVEQEAELRARVRNFARAWAEAKARAEAANRNVMPFHRRAQRAEAETAQVRREAIGQRKRADYWKAEAKRLGWKIEAEVKEVGPLEDRIHRDPGRARAAKSARSPAVTK